MRGNETKVQSPKAVTDTPEKPEQPVASSHGCCGRPTGHVCCGHHHAHQTPDKDETKDTEPVK